MHAHVCVHAYSKILSSPSKKTWRWPVHAKVCSCPLNTTHVTQLCLTIHIFPSFTHTKGMTNFLGNWPTYCSYVTYNTVSSGTGSWRFGEVYIFKREVVTLSCSLTSGCPCFRSAHFLIFEVVAAGQVSRVVVWLRFGTCLNHVARRGYELWVTTFMKNVMLYIFRIDVTRCWFRYSDYYGIKNVMNLST